MIPSSRSNVCEPVTGVRPFKVIAAGVWIAPVVSRPAICILVAVSEAELDTKSTAPLGEMS